MKFKVLVLTIIFCLLLGACGLETESSGNTEEADFKIIGKLKMEKSSGLKTILIYEDKKTGCQYLSEKG